MSGGVYLHFALPLRESERADALPAPVRHEEKVDAKGRLMATILVAGMLAVVPRTLVRPAAPLRAVQHIDSTWAARSAIDAVGMAAGRRRRGKKMDGPPPPPRVMQRVESGVPAVAQTHPEKYEELLNSKLATLRSLLQAATGDTELPEVEVHESAREHFRMRAAFATWREGKEVHYIMFNEGDSRTPIQCTSFPMGSVLINQLMPVVRAAMESDPVLSERINDVRFLTTTTGEALVSLTYNRPLNDTWVESATRLQQQLTVDSGLACLGNSGGAGGKPSGSQLVRLVGRSRKVKLVVGGETVSESLNVPGRGVCSYTQTEGAFTQPNANVCEAMLGWAFDATRGSEEEDLCELYCGNGCFTVALAPNFRRVVATEVSRASVALANANLADNGITNTRVAAVSAEDFVQAYSGQRSLRRLAMAGIRIEARQSGLLAVAPGAAERGSGGSSSGGSGSGGGAGQPAGDAAGDAAVETMSFDRLRTLFVDPPRAGLDATCRKLAATFDKVVYVSCNPETLARDLEELTMTHRVTRLAAFDQFPYTPHLEAGVLLVRRD